MSTICKNNFLTAYAPKADAAKSPLLSRCEAFFRTREARVVTALFLALAALAVSQGAFAWTTPTAGSFGYNIYDIAIEKVAKGPIGFVGGGWLIALGATKLNEGWTRALPFIVGGSCLIKVEELTTSLGSIIH
ncbi:conjugative transfer protein TraE [Enterobacter hormaechei]|uniref:conjugative transfer protein TraE n=1 Tax=Enterobacter hormaechei TaxID=158836 RepID=UPI0026EACDCC|nr:conjugative transfer protein TraE [Enterobacter hormaechei]